jgi:hypothetical protein
MAPVRDARTVRHMLTPTVTCLGHLPSAHPRGAPSGRVAPGGVVAERIDRVRLARPAVMPTVAGPQRVAA